MSSLVKCIFLWPLALKDYPSHYIWSELADVIYESLNQQSYG